MLTRVGHSDKLEQMRGFSIVFDTNVWLKERLFRSSIGAAILFGVKARQHKLLVSDVLRDEIVARVRDTALKASSRAESDLSTLQAIMGSRSDIRFPEISHIDAAIQKRWVDLAFAPGRDIHFVSEDKDFGASGQLHPELQEEVTRLGLKVTYYTEAERLLQAIVPEVPISVAAVRQSVLSALGRRLAELRSEPMFDIGDVVRTEAKAYATERPERAAVTFELALAATRREQGTPGELIVRGECASDTETGAIVDVRPQDIIFKTASGESKLVIYFEAAGALRDRPYTVRREIFEA